MAKRRTRSGLVVLSWPTVFMEMCDKGFSADKLRNRADISAETWQRIIEEKEIRMDSAHDVAEALSVPLRTLLHPKTLTELAAGIRTTLPGPGLADWQLDEPLGGYPKCSNGLSFFTWRLKHRSEKDRYARGKRYDLQELATDEQERIAGCLSRHGDVCNLVEKSKYFPRHVTTTPDPDGKSWWSIDKWTEGKPLWELIYHNLIPAKSAPRLMRNIAKGLKELHEADVIYREMSTRSILVTNVEKGSVVLTDFELGKLFDGNPTVRGSGPGNPYRAEEVGDRELTQRDSHVDLYSWGRILIHVTTQGLPPRRQEGTVLEAARLTDSVRKIAARCVSPDPDARPRSADEVLRAIRGWR